MSFKNIFKKEKKVIVIVVICLTLLVIGTSYALFLQVHNNTNNQIVKSGTLDITYSNGNEIVIDNDDENNCLDPKSDEDGKTSGCLFQFSAKNTGNLPAAYDLNIKENPLTGKSLVNKNMIRYSLKKTYTNDPSKNAVITEAKSLDETDKLESSIIAAGETIEFTMYIWISDTYDEITDNYISLKIDVSSTVYEDEPATATLLSGLGENGLEEIMSDTSVASENSSNIKDYRYTKKDSQNYVKFNCNEGNCETWRILGIYNIDNQSRIKLVRNDALEDIMAWDTNNGTTFNTSSIQSYLNNDYYESLSSDAKGQINNAAFRLGGTSSLDINSKEAYKQELESGLVIKDIKVGLMTLSDYALASGLASDSLLVNIASANEGNWLYKANSPEWLLTKGSLIYSIDDSGNLTNSATNNQKKIRPTVYLANNIKIVGGQGTLNEPYELSK